MKNTIFLLLALGALFHNARGQELPAIPEQNLILPEAETSVRDKDREFEFGIIMPLAAIHDDWDEDPNIMIPGAYVEWRWFLRNRNQTLGLHLSISDVLRGRGSGGTHHLAIPILCVYSLKIKQGRNADVHMGIGAGFSFNVMPDELVLSAILLFRPAIVPRIEVRLFDKFNISAGLLVTHLEYTRLFCSAGMYF